ncbi:MAG: sulfatase-like hydrolase/transferase, partial [Kiritimatiellales bacterium]
RRQVAFEGHLTDWLGDRAAEFIQAEQADPLFVFLSFTAPHVPMEALQADMDAMGTDDPYVGLVYGLDRNVGKVMDALKARGRLENTLIWFLSDNGGLVRQASNFPLGGKKGTEFEGGQRVPFLVSWKKEIPSGVYTSMVSSLDIYPTCVRAAGGSLEQSRPLDGVDLLPYLTGKNAERPHPQLFWRKLECAAVRDGDWKLIRVENYGYALYNLAEDIGEMHDLAAQMPEKVDQMRRQLEGWETDKMTPLWQEGEKWVGVRYRDHTVKFKTGLLPGRVLGSRMVGQ